MVPSEPAQRHRVVAGAFTDRVRGTRSWDAPAPVAGWTARDVVGHLIEWFPAFLADGADPQTALLGFIGRDPCWTPAGR